MKDLISNQLVKYLEARGVEHIFGLCGHTNIAVLAALSKSKKIKFINTRHEQIAAHMADGYARAKKQDRGRAVAPLPRTHERRHRRRQRCARLGADGGDRRRRAEPLLRQASAPGSEPARRRVAIRNLSALRQARLARGPAASFSRDHRKGVRARREWPSGARAGRRADGHLLQGDRRQVVGAAAAQHQEIEEAVAGRRDRGRDRQEAARCEKAGALRRRRHHARRRNRRAARIRRPSADSCCAHADGQGRAAGRPSVHPRHDGLLGHQIHQRPMPRGRLDPRPRHAILRGGLQFVGAGIHVQFSADQAHPDRHRSRRDRPQLPGRNRRGRRPQAGAQGAESRRPQAGTEGRAAAGACERTGEGARRIRRRQQGACDKQCLSDATRADSGRRPRSAAARRADHDRRGLEQERRRPAVSDPRSRHDLHAGRLRDDGVRRTGGAWREDRVSRPCRRRAGR